ARNLGQRDAIVRCRNQFQNLQRAIEHRDRAGLVRQFRSYLRPQIWTESPGAPAHEKGNQFIFNRGALRDALSDPSVSPDCGTDRRGGENKRAAAIRSRCSARFDGEVWVLPRTQAADGGAGYAPGVASSAGQPEWSGDRKGISRKESAGEARARWLHAAGWA